MKFNSIQLKKNEMQICAEGTENLLVTIELENKKL
jgi:hypothetical protein